MMSNSTFPLSLSPSTPLSCFYVEVLGLRLLLFSVRLTGGITSMRREKKKKKILIPMRSDVNLSLLEKWAIKTLKKLL